MVIDKLAVITNLRLSNDFVKSFLISIFFCFIPAFLALLAWEFIMVPREKRIIGNKDTVDKQVISKVVNDFYKNVAANNAENIKPLI